MTDKICPFMSGVVRVFQRVGDDKNELVEVPCIRELCMAYAGRWSDEDHCKLIGNV